MSEFKLINMLKKLTILILLTSCNPPLPVAKYKQGDIVCLKLDKSKKTIITFVTPTREVYYGNRLENGDIKREAYQEFELCDCK